MSGNRKRPGAVFCNSLLLLIISSSIAAAEFQERVELPEFEKKALLNGMQFLFLDAASERVPFLLMIKNGAAFDPAGKWGATYIMARMLAQNLERDPFREDLERSQIQIDFKVGWDAIYCLGESPAGALEQALTVLAEIVTRPEFEEDLFTEVRNVVLQEVTEKSNRIESRTETVFREKIFSENPYGHPVTGTERTLRNLDIRDVKVQFRRLMMPNQARLALCFSGDREGLFRRLSRRWGSWVKGEPAPFTFRHASKPEQALLVVVNMPTSGESLIRWGYLGVSKNSSDYYALKVLEQYLTLFLPEWAEKISAKNQIRGRAKLVARRMAGYLQVSLQSPSSEVASYYQQIHELIDRLKSGQIDPQRFEEAKLLVLHEFKDSLEQPVERLRGLLATDLYELGVNHIPTFGLRLKRVTPEVFQSVVASHLPGGQFVMVVGGPAAELKPVLEQIGTVEVLN